MLIHPTAALYAASRLRGSDFRPSGIVRRIEQNRAEQSRAEQNRTEQNR
eukprot:COSAG06_NODE_34869_length_468_cov_0.804878_1_plen_48_part_01